MRRRQLFSSASPELLPSTLTLLQSITLTSMAASSHPSSQSTPEDDDELCSSLVANCSLDSTHSSPSSQSFPPSPESPLIAGLGRVERAWAHWRRLGSPKLIVAPMVDNSELPFRMLFRKYGAQAAYTPMLHSRIFNENAKYRSLEFTTCKEDRPLFVQFCANDPNTLLESARLVERVCDYTTTTKPFPILDGVGYMDSLFPHIPIVCHRIARRGNYGAFLMDNLPLIKPLVEKLALNLHVLVSCKIRIFPRLEDTHAYAKMLEEAGCSLLAVHGRTRDQKDGKSVRADWNAIKAIKEALHIPVIANGNLRHLDDAYACLETTGADGVLSAESLLENPALFAGFRTTEWRQNEDEKSELNQAELVVDYLKMCEKHPVPWRMVRSHVHKMLGDWFTIHPDIREELNRQSRLSFEWLYDMVNRLRERDVRLPLYLKGIPAN